MSSFTSNKFYLFCILFLFFTKISWSQSSTIELLKKQIDVKPQGVINVSRAKLTTSLGIDSFGIFYCMGKSYRILGQLDSALHYMYKSLSRESILSDKEKISFYTELGIVLKQQFKTALALPYYQKALHLTENTGDKPGYSRLLNNIGRVHFDLRNFDDAEYFYRRALEINSDDQIKSNSILYHNLGAIFEKRNILDSARYYYDKALDGYNKINDKILIAYGFCTQARLETNSFKAFQLIDKSIVIRKELCLIADLEESLLVKAQLFFNQNDSYKALILVDSIEVLVQKTGHFNILKEVLKLKSDIFAYRGNYKEAYYYQKKYIELQNNEIDAETARLITGITIELKHGQTVRELELLRKQDSLQQGVILAKNEAIVSKSKQNFQVSILLLFVLGISILLIILLRKLKRKNGILNEQSKALYQSNEEKEILLKEVNHRVKNNLQIAIGIVRRGIDNIKDIEAKKIIYENILSVETIAMIHETIYRQKQLSKIDVSKYVQDLSEKSLSGFRHNKEYLLKVIPFKSTINAEQAIHLGHFVCEWILNTLKHAQPADDILELEVGQIEDKGKYYLYFKDNGSKTNKEAFLNSTQFGNRLIRSSVRKLSDHELLVNDENGFELKFNCTKWHEK
jgi:two-component sensor histidine kinase